jgi:hypothetical protein
MANKTKKHHKKPAPRSEKHESSAETVHVEQIHEADVKDGAPTEVENETQQEAPVRVEFPYSEVVRSYVPDAMAVADRALADWKHEGSFMNLGIENPYANMAVSIGLQNAKKVEKKLEEKGVLPVVRMGFEVLKTKLKKS